MLSRLPYFRGAFSRPISLNAYLVRLIIGVLGPLLVFSIFMMVLFARQEQAGRQRGLESATRALTLAIDQELKSSITKLEALATSEPLDYGRAKVFEAIAARFLSTQDNWRSITLFTPRGERVISVAKPLIEAAAPMSAPTLAEVLQTGRPVVSDFPQRGGHGAGIDVHVPVVRERTIIYILSAAIEPRVFTEILAQQRIPPEWIGTLYDSGKVVIARSRDARQFIGEPVGPLLARTNVLGGEQFLRGADAEGVASYAAVSRSQVAGWFFALTVPRAELNEVLYSSVAAVAGGGLLLLLSALGVGLLFARRASNSITRLAAAAHNLGRGQSVSFPAGSPIAELDGLATEMARAARLLREREEERDRVEEELRRQEEDLLRQADLLNLANEAIVAIQLDSRILYWNRGAEQLYGYSQQEAIGASSHELLATEFPEDWSAFKTALIEAGEWSGELKQKTKHGRYIDVESRFKLIHTRDGGRLILECSRDISQRKKAAQRLAVEHQVSLVLAESETPEAAWQRLLEIIGSGFEWEAAAFWRVNKQSQMLECANIWQSPAVEFGDCRQRPALARGMGLPGRVWQNQAPMWIADVVKEATTLRISYPDHEQVRAAFAFPIQMRSEVLGVIEFISRTPREPDDEVLKTVQAVGGEIGQFIERMRAEAALRESEEHLRTQAQQLEQQLLASGRLVAVGELTASMAHEFNNPLGIILGFAQGLLESMDPSDPDFAQVRIIADEAKRCENLVQELLEFGRPKSAEFIRADIGRIIERTIHLVQPHAAKNGVETRIEMADELPLMYADPQQLQQILLNLSLNAVDAMPKGGTLTVRATREGSDGMLIAVSDTGMGIDADLLGRIFQPFFTSKKRRGLGLGLPICDRIARSHGGKIRVKSRPGEGTTFEVYLPLVPPAAGEVLQREAEASVH